MSFYRKLTIQRLMVAILFILLFVMAVRVPTDTDAWWHVRSGEYIVENREIPKTDPFSHTRYGEDWIDQSWGAQIIIYGFYDLFGGGREPGDSGNIGLALFMAGMAALGMVFVYLMCEGNVYLRSFAVILGAAAAAVFWSPRPQMFSFTLGALVLYLLHLYKRERLDRLWLIPPIMLIWANLHGGFAIGLIFLFGSITGEVLGNLLNPDDFDVVQWGRLRKMVIVAGASFLVIAVNPHGVQMWGYPLRTVRIGVLQDFIQEWASPDFHTLITWPFLVLLLGTLAVVALSSRRIDWTDLTLVIGTAAMAMAAGRNVAVFAIAATPVFTRHLNVWLHDRGGQLRIRRSVNKRILITNWTLLGLVIVFGLVKIGSALNEKTVREGQELYFPVELARFLEETPPPGKMFNSYNWGGYLMFAAPDVPVYVDGRTDLYDDEFLREYLDISLLREGWETALDEHEIGFVAVESDSILAAALRMRQWEERQFDDERSSLFVRGAPAQRVP